MNAFRVSSTFEVEGVKKITFVLVENLMLISMTSDCDLLVTGLVSRKTKCVLGNSLGKFVNTSEDITNEALSFSGDMIASTLMGLPKSRADLTSPIGLPGSSSWSSKFNWLRNEVFALTMTSRGLMPLAVNKLFTSPRRSEK